MLTTLRDDSQPVGGVDGPSIHGVDQLPDLLDDARAAGVAAELTVVGDARPLTPLVSITVYRVVQEAVTNAIKHAGTSASIDVRLRFLDAMVEVEVTDSGGVTARSPNAPGSGLGIIGMRERLAAVGGTLEAGPRARGGYLVRADIPTATTATTATTNFAAPDFIASATTTEAPQ
jgi:signal transduction histidine kinase